LSNIYCPSTAAGKLAFSTWLVNLDTTSFEDWILAGDFNMYRSGEDRNKPGGDPKGMQMFNNLISLLDFIDLLFSGRRYTWSNMQTDPLLVTLDWVLCSSSWSLSYLETSVQPLSRPISDYIPFVIKIGRNIAKSSLFRFENYWVQHAIFLKVVDLH
jgi:endonuclease/exonuclease/phosphatase family metal-dependent hydrolase